MNEKKEIRVQGIENGTVIDHIPSRKGLRVLEILGLSHQRNDSVITMGINFIGSRGIAKDFLKIENKSLTQDELNKIALVAPNATINIIRNSEVFQKRKVEVPDKFVKLILCTNPSCITRNEPVDAVFFTVSKNPLIIQCKYCEKIISEDEIKLN